METITKITQTSNGNVRLLDASDNIEYQISHNKTVALHPFDSSKIMIGNDLIKDDINPSKVIIIDPSVITHVGGVAFSGDAQDLIEDLDSFFF